MVMVIITFVLLSCQNDWAKENMEQGNDYIGRLRERKAMTPENSWTKRERYSWQMVMENQNTTTITCVPMRE